MRGSLSIAVWTVALSLPVACGGDDGGDDGTLTAPTSVSASGADSTGDASGGPASSGDADSSSGGGSSTGSADATGSADSSSGGGAAQDPSYPAPGPAGCPNGTADIMLQGINACAPLCDGRGGACPMPATGDATPDCTPFEMPGGSNTACMDDGECTDPEVCGPEGSCILVAFYGCRLLCGAGQTCPDAMTCAGVGACGY